MEPPLIPSEWMQWVVHAWLDYQWSDVDTRFLYLPVCRVDVGVCEWVGPSQDARGGNLLVGKVDNPEKVYPGTLRLAEL